MNRAIAPLALVALAALAGCKGSDKPAQEATAVGEVLPGSASDAMIPLDTVRSQPPLAPPSAGNDKPGAKKKGAAGGSSEDLPDVGPAAEDAPSLTIPAPSPSE